MAQRRMDMHEQETSLVRQRFEKGLGYIYLLGFLSFVIMIIMFIFFDSKPDKVTVIMTTLISAIYFYEQYQEQRKKAEHERIYREKHSQRW